MGVRCRFNSLVKKVSRNPRAGMFRIVDFAILYCCSATVSELVCGGTSCGYKSEFSEHTCLAMRLLVRRLESDVVDGEARDHWLELEATEPVFWEISGNSPEEQRRNLNPLH